MVQKELLSTEDNLRIFYERNDDIDGLGVTVDNTSYDAGTFIDRDYDVKQFDGFMIKLENVGPQSVDYTILSTTKDFVSMDADLNDADFSEEEVATNPILTTAKSATFIHVRVAPDVMAIRLRCKLTAATADSKIRADIRGFIN